MYELYHHGIKGQKWGVRRYQNPDGSLTAAGRKRLGQIDERADKWINEEKKAVEKIINSKKGSNAEYLYNRISDKRRHDINNFRNYKKKAILDPSVKKTKQYKEADRAMNRLILSNQDRATGAVVSTSFGVMNDAAEFNRVHKKTVKALKKYRNATFSGKDRKIEKARNKLNRTIEKANNVTMDVAYARISGYKFGNSEDDVHVDYEFLRNYK